MSRKAEYRSRNTSSGSSFSSDQANTCHPGSSRTTGNGVVHCASHTWRSETTKERDNFERVSHRVKHIAPRLFPIPSKPHHVPCDIFPQNFGDWNRHRLAMLVLAQHEQKINIQNMIVQAEAHQKPSTLPRRFQSTFKEDARVLSDGRGLVLAQETIWSAKHVKEADGVANWPSWSDLPSNDEARISTNPTRRLPHPRMVTDTSIPFRERPLAVIQPFDKTSADVGAQRGRTSDGSLTDSYLDRDMAFYDRCMMLLGNVRDFE